MSDLAAVSPPGLLSAGPIPGARQELATRWIGVFIFAKLLAHFVTVAVTPYEVHRDEFLYWAMGKHLAVWGMDFPPAIAFLARTASFLFGDTLFAVRLFPALAGAGIIALGALLAREFGGGRPAQLLAMVALLFGPLFIRPAALFHPVVLDQLCWTLALFVLAKLLQENRRRWWLLLGVAGGLGLLAKFSVLFLAFGMLVALLVSERRKMLLTRGPWFAVLTALAIGSPTWIGQLRLHLPVIIHMTDLRSQQLANHVTVAGFLFGQVWMLGPALLVAVAGFVFLWRDGCFRIVAVSCAAAFLLLLVLHGKPYYIGPIYPTLLAAGAVAIEQSPQPRRRQLRALAFSILIIAGLVVLPLGLPLLPAPVMARYCAWLGLQAAVTTNRGTVLPLPQDYADMLGWKEQVQAVANAFATLTPDERSRAGLIARNYGEAGALDFYARRYGLAGVPIMLPDNFLLWPPVPGRDVVVTIGIPPADLEKFCRHVRVLSRFDHPWMVEEERNRVICIADTPTRDLREGWKQRRVW